MQFYSKDLGFIDPVTAGAVGSKIMAGADFITKISSMFGGGEGTNVARKFSAEVGTGQEFSQKQARGFRNQVLKEMGISLQEYEASPAMFPGVRQRMIELARGAAPRAVTGPVRVSQTTQPFQPVMTGPNIARDFSLRAGTGREYTEAEKNALVMRGQQIGVSGEQMARIEAGMEPYPGQARPTAPGFDFSKLLDVLIKPAGAAPTPGIAPAYTPQQPLVIDTGRQAPPVPAQIPPVVWLGGAALLGTMLFMTRKKR